MVWVGRELKEHPVPIPHPQAGNLPHNIREMCKQILFFPECSQALPAAHLLGQIPAALSKADLFFLPNSPFSQSLFTFPLSQRPPDSIPCSPWGQPRCSGRSRIGVFLKFWHPPGSPAGMKLQFPLLLGAHFLPDTAISWLDLKWQRESRSIPKHPGFSSWDLSLGSGTSPEGSVSSDNGSLFSKGEADPGMLWG